MEFNSISSGFVCSDSYISSINDTIKIQKILKFVDKETGKSVKDYNDYEIGKEYVYSELYAVIKGFLELAVYDSEEKAKEKLEEIKQSLKDGKQFIEIK